MNWETLLSFGDSITLGARSYLGYPEICGDILGKHLGKNWHVINHSTNGFTTMDLVRSIDPVLSNYKNCFPGIITVLIGTNDIKNRVKADDFIIAYRQLITKLRLIAVNDNIILIRIPRFTQKVFYPYNFSMNDQIITFNAAIEDLGTENGLRCFDFIFSEDDYFDGVHLSPKGCHTAANQLSGLVLKDKGIENTAGLS